MSCEFSLYTKILETQPFVTKDPTSDYFLIRLTITANTLGWLFFVAQIVCVSGERGVVINHLPSLHSKSTAFFIRKGKMLSPLPCCRF